MGCQHSKLTKTSTGVVAAPQAVVPQVTKESEETATQPIAEVDAPAECAVECAEITAATTEVQVESVVAVTAPELSKPVTAASPTNVSQTSPKRVGLGERSMSAANCASPTVQKGGESSVDTCGLFSEYLKASENVAPAADATGKRKVAFDAETMRKTAPKPSSHAAGPTASKTLTKKQAEMLKKQHVSAGRRGPVAPKWDKGSKSQMQTDVYLEMAAAFERMLTNAETINAHLDSR